MGVKRNLSTRTRNHAADPEIGFLTKSISKPYSRATAMPPAWELKSTIRKKIKKQFFVKKLIKYML